MRHLLVYILGLSLLTASCGQVDNKTTATPQTDTAYALTEQPAKTIFDFLNWYRDNQGIQGGLVNNSSNETYDSTKFYSVNFDATEGYLAKLKATGFISDTYAGKWREYFKKCDKWFQDNPSNDGPPNGFDYDFIMHSQDYEDGLNNLDKSKIFSQSVLADSATIKIHFSDGNKLVYKLTKHADNWIIDDIVRGFE